MSSKKKSTKSIEPVKEIVAREPVIERGDELLQRLYDDGDMYLTKNEGEEIVQNGDAIAVAGEIDEFGAVLVQLTLQGASKVAGENQDRVYEPDFDNDEPVSKATYEVDDYAPDVSKIVRHRGPPGGKRGSKYPFDALGVGQSFHVALNDKIGDPVKTLQSSVTKANTQYTENVSDDDGNLLLENKTIKTYKRGEDGKLLRKDGHFIIETSEIQQVPVARQTRKFIVVHAQTDDPKGPGARVVRVQ
jgi:hypothetical protein